MGLQTAISRTTSFFKNFSKDRRGGVALMAGFAFPVIFIGAGGALDYSNAVAKKQQAQRAMDSAVLALTRRDLDDIDVQAEGQELFSSYLEARELIGDLDSINFTLTDTLISGSAVIDSPTYFLGYVGMDTMMAKVESSAVPPINRPIEIALVLDISGSMSAPLNGSTRIEQLKSSVNNMFDTLDDTLPSGAEVRASVVPYSTSVNISDYSGAASATSVGGQPQESEIWAAERFVASNGVDFVINDAGPGTSEIPFVTGSEMGNSRPLARMAALTDDIGEVRASVDAMQPDGWTAGHIGMAWGLYSLSENWGGFWPTAPEAIGDSDKIIVFLSDGEFNTTHNIGAQSNDDGDVSNAYFQEVCTLARDQGFRIYTVALALDPVSETRLAECVGSTGQLYKADSANDLSQAFEDIARRLGTHRLTS